MSTNHTTIISVAIPTPLRQLFDYLPPPAGATASAANITPGVRVLVPFGRRKVVGFVIEVLPIAQAQVAIAKLKPILQVLDTTPLLPRSIVDLLHWTSRYYHHALGDVLINALPSLLRQEKQVFTGKTSLENTEYNQILAKTDFTKFNFTPNAQQQNAIDIITAQLTQGFKTFLLHGVTGSGKTEVYLQTITAAISNGKQALVLVPEINLTPQTVARFQERFAVPIVILHSRRTHKQRLQAWTDALDGTAAIIIGTRSAIFTPLKNPGIIIIDEEHDLSFKQQAGLRYSARDLAVIRGKLENIPVVLGSATPALESMHNAQRGRYQLLSLPHRVGAAKQPPFHLLDMRAQKTNDGLTPGLLQAIERHLMDNGQVLIFLNRRGYAPVSLCPSCNSIVDCQHCAAHMTFHRDTQKLHCHHCNAAVPIPKQCAKCGATQFITLGIGTERLEDVLSKLFPEANVIRIDQDAMRRKNAMQQTLDKIHAGDCNILIGTQMLAKGHHFPNVTMVAILNADNGLFSTDFRATEHLAQLIIQVAGRAGREERPGEVYIQTHNPHHPLLLQLLAEGYSKFAQINLEERMQAQLPPFAYMAMLRAEGKNKNAVEQFLHHIRDLGKNLIMPHVAVYGPITSILERKAGQHRMQLLIQSERREQLHNYLDKIIANITKLKINRGIKWNLDVDPVEM